MRRGSLTSVAECFPWQESVLSDDFRCVCLFSSEKIWQRSTNPANYRHTASQSRSCIQPSIIDSYCVLICGVKIYVKNKFCKLYHFSSCLLAKFPSCMFQLGLSDNGVPKLGCPCPYVSHEIIIWGRYTPISSRTNSFLVPRCSQRQKSNFWLSINYHSHRSPKTSIISAPMFPSSHPKKWPTFESGSCEACVARPRHSA